MTPLDVFLRRGAWTHSVCLECWEHVRPGSIPHRIEPPPTDRCCCCGALHDSGIYVHQAPEEYGCKGQHPCPALQQSFTEEPKP